MEWEILKVHLFWSNDVVTGDERTAGLVVCKMGFLSIWYFLW